MITIISPTKNIDNKPLATPIETSTPEFTDTANRIANQLKKLNVDELSELFNVSTNIATLNHHRYQIWQQKTEVDSQLAAILLFNGEVYRGLQANTMSPADLAFANNNLRILSGLYGILKPLDSIQPYRLEMGTKWGGANHTSLYSIWSKCVTQTLIQALNQSIGEKVLINLASSEYSKVIDKKSFNLPILTIDFKKLENGQLKNITVYAKRARGLMARFIVDEQITESEYLKAFTNEGYYFSVEHSTDDKWVFIQ